MAKTGRIYFWLNIKINPSLFCLESGQAQLLG